ncbi:MAG: hypothetical protein IPG99_09535 [Ignavibacteria bacterium]|nr:hypothetical protein [Ignavibacteria bacterium]
MLAADIIGKYKVIFDYCDKKIIFSKDEIDFDGAKIPFKVVMEFPSLNSQLLPAISDVFSIRGKALVS